MTPALLDVRNLAAGYVRGSAIVQGVSLQVGAGEIVTLIGRNGMGKSTTLKAIMGMLLPWSGEVLFRGENVAAWPPHKTARAGIGLVPEGRHIFPNLTVEENLVAAARNPHRRSPGWDLAPIYVMFPRLQERRRNMGTELSGGEQQMLSIGRALMTNPHLLILDEATEGLAPVIRDEIWKCLARLRETGVSMIVVDKNIGPLLRNGDRHYILEKGSIVWSGTSDELRQNRQILSYHVGV